MTMILNFVTIIGGLFEGDVVAKLVSFGVNGVIIFQGLNIGVIVQLIEKHAPFVTSILYMANPFLPYHWLQKLKA
jgi:hypothetical protein